jgi:AcrR family transcriptional regulator
MVEETTTELIRATYRALCKHGYANLTMQDIADESTKSKAALHYHYDTKQDLLLAFLSFLYERFEERVRTPEGENPRERLVVFIDAALTPPERDEQLAFQTAFLEIKTQVPYNEGFSEQIAQFDDLLHEQCRSIVAEGIEAGVFRETDPDAIATFFVTLFNGDHVLWVTENQSSDTTRQLFVDYIESQLLADDAPEVHVE